MKQKWEENIPKFCFCIRAPTFSTHMPWPFKICFTNKVNTVCGGVQVTGSQGPITRVPGVGSHGPGLKVLRPRPSSRVPGSQVSGSQGPRSQSFRTRDPGSQGLWSGVSGSRVSGPSFRLFHFKCTYHKKGYKNHF